MGRGLLALVGPLMVAGGLVASGMPHSSLVLGSGDLGLGLGGSRASSLRSLQVSPDREYDVVTEHVLYNYWHTYQS